MSQQYGIEALWQQSDIVIKAVAIILLIMSVLSWMVILVRSWQVIGIRKLGKQTELFWQAKNLQDGIKQLGDNPDNPFFRLANEGKKSLDHHIQHKNDLQQILPLTDWLTTCLRNSIDEFAEKLQLGMGILASVGSTSPFIGLFGTVWGIYHALIGISMAGHVNISEVAGPIGESLIMTAFGLVVAIPAVLGFNGINRGNKKTMNKLNRFAYQLHAFFLTGATPANSNMQAVDITTPNKAD